MAPVDVRVPDIGDFTDVPIVEVLVSVGDDVGKDDPLVVLESDKASMEIPAPEAGKVAELLVEVGDTVSEGTVIAKIEAASNGGAPAPSAPSGESTANSAADPPLDEHKPLPDEVSTPATEPSADGEPVYASPSVRRRARELGVDLSTVGGTGRKGRITVEDVEGASKAPAPAAAGAPATTAVPAGSERVALTRIQQRSAENLSTAWQTIPHVTHHEEADITDLEAFRKRLNAEQSDVKVTMVALLLRACATSLRAFPRFASSLDGDALIVKHDLHIGFAADTPNGLVVPVIRDVDRKGLLELAGELTSLSVKAREGKLSPKEMSGAVFTISSLGGIGGTNFSPIVNPPQVAILGVVRSAMKPVWDGKEFVPRLMLPLSLSYDHRVIDGAGAARFCVHLRGVLEDLRRVLL